MAFFYCKPHDTHFQRQTLDGPWCPDCEAQDDHMAAILYAKEEQLRYEGLQAQDILEYKGE